MAHQWTVPYYGVQHLGQFGTKRSWVTVNECGARAELLRWFPGCQFSPLHSTHDSTADARAAGEAWLRTQE